MLRFIGKAFDRAIRILGRRELPDSGERDSPDRRFTSRRRFYTIWRSAVARRGAKPWSGPIAAR